MTGGRRKHEVRIVAEEPVEARRWDRMRRSLRIALDPSKDQRRDDLQAQGASARTSPMQLSTSTT